MSKFYPIAQCVAIIAMSNICIPGNIPSKQFLQAHQSSSNFTKMCKITNSIFAAPCAGAQCHLYNWVLNIMAPMLWSLTSGTNCFKFGALSQLHCPTTIINDRLVQSHRRQVNTLPDRIRYSGTAAN